MLTEEYISEVLVELAQKEGSDTELQYCMQEFLRSLISNGIEIQTFIQNNIKVHRIIEEDYRIEGYDYCGDCDGRDGDCACCPNY